MRKREPVNSCSGFQPSGYSSVLQKQIDKSLQQQRQESNIANYNSEHGHLKQTKEYSSEVVVKWIDMQLRVIRGTGGMPPATNSRLFAYAGVALYESVVPGMPSYQSLSGQLTSLSGMPSPVPGFAYQWAICANSALAFISKQFFPGTEEINKISMDSLETALNSSYKSDVDLPTFNRSVAFGKAVAQSIFDWSKADGSATGGQLTYTQPGPGFWVPTFPNFPAPSTPYWGRNRLFVTGFFPSKGWMALEIWEVSAPTTQDRLVNYKLATSLPIHLLSTSQKWIVPLPYQKLPND